MEIGEVVHFETAEALRGWFESHHGECDVLWVGYWKRATGRQSITWEESVDQALCFGWIDGVRKRVDDEAYTVRFTPRRRGSIWSRRNIERYEALAAQGLIAPAGEVVYAERTEEKSGVYSFEQEAPQTLAPRFLERLRQAADAWCDWESRPPGYRKQVTHWVMSAKREETRERRFRALLEDSRAGRKVKPLRRSGE
jgi:uncharacterized protein YdeI (YjbR/CyaY-like superfamily)